MAAPGESFDPRQDEEERPHVGRLLLHPDQVAGLRETIELGREFLGGERVELLDGDDGGLGIATAFALGSQVVADSALLR